MSIGKKIQQVEFFTLILAVIMTVISGLGLSYSIEEVVKYTIGWKRNYGQDKKLPSGDLSERNLSLRLTLHLYALAMVLFGLDLAMNIVLCHAVYKVKPVCMKVSFCYGLLKCVTFLFVAGVLCDMQLILDGILVFFGVGVYVIILMLIYKTMRKFETKLQNVPVRIEEEPVQTYL